MSLQKNKISSHMVMTDRNKCKKCLLNTTTCNSNVQLILFCYCYDKTFLSNKDLHHLSY